MTKKKVNKLFEEMIFYVSHLKSCSALTVGHEIRDNVVHKVYKIEGECDCGYDKIMKKLKQVL